MNPRREHLQQEQEKGPPWIHLHHHQSVQSTRIEGQQIRFGCFWRRRSSQRTSLPHHRGRTHELRQEIRPWCPFLGLRRGHSHGFCRRCHRFRGQELPMENWSQEKHHRRQLLPMHGQNPASN